MHRRNEKMMDITDATIQLVYDIGAGMTVELDVVNVYAISANTFADNSYTHLHSSCKINVQDRAGLDSISRY
jgi:hypothetical protein